MAAFQSRRIQELLGIPRVEDAWYPNFMTLVTNQAVKRSTWTTRADCTVTPIVIRGRLRETWRRWRNRPALLTGNLDRNARGSRLFYVR